MLFRSDVWVEANFKETQLERIRPGQTAAVAVDASPRHRYMARVTRMSPGTGASFAALPPENATGNWIKVVQRVPVRLQMLDWDSAIAVPDGLSVVVTVNTTDR